MKQVKTLHIGDASSWEGSMKVLMHKESSEGCCDVKSFPYSFATGCLPQNLSRAELGRCLEGIYTRLYDENVIRFAEIDLDKYDRIVIWHTLDSNSLLLLYFFSTVVKGDLYHCLIKGDENNRTGSASFENLQEGINNIQVVSREERLMFNEMYCSIRETQGKPKVADGYNIKCVSKDYLKNLLMKNTGKEPKKCFRIIMETLEKFPKEYTLDSDHLLCLMLEMIEDGILIPVDIIRERAARQYPIGDFFRKQYQYRGENMNKWYDFSVIRY